MDDTGSSDQRAGADEPDQHRHDDREDRDAGPIKTRGRRIRHIRRRHIAGGWLPGVELSAEAAIMTIMIKNAVSARNGILIKPNQSM